jgi:hypothetical protein
VVFVIIYQVMFSLFNRDIDLKKLRDRIGDLSQIAGIRRMTLQDGREAGVRTAEVRTGSGLRYFVTIDRGMDISLADYRGIPLSWRSGHGDVHPSYFNPVGTGWADSFPGGLMTGCGMTYVGAPCTDNGEQLGLHGRLSSTPAKDVSIRNIENEARGSFEVTGTIHEISFFGYHIVLRRTIQSGFGESAIHVSDSFRNIGTSPAPFMMLYHINLGWPLLDVGSKFYINCEKSVPRDQAARRGINNCTSFEEPYDRYDEQVFYHNVRSDNEGFAHAVLYNRDLELALHIRYRKRELPRLVQWKMMLKGYYVLGIEPANCLVEGRHKERERGTLKFLQPDEEVQQALSIMVHEGNGEINSLLREYSLEWQIRK